MKKIDKHLITKIQSIGLAVAMLMLLVAAVFPLLGIMKEEMMLMRYVYAAGAAVNGMKIAVGLAASGETVVGREAAGANILLCGNGLNRGEVEAFLMSHYPTLWRPLLHFFSALGACIG